MNIFFYPRLENSSFNFQVSQNVLNPEHITSDCVCLATHLGSICSYRAHHFFGLFSCFSEGELNQKAHGCWQLSLHHEFGSSPADMGGVEELPGRLSVCFDHGFQGTTLDWIFYRRHIHAKICLQMENKPVRENSKQTFVFKIF